MGNNNEAKITIVGDAEQLRGLIRVLNTDLDSLGKGPTADPFKPLVDGATSASEKLTALGISVDRSYAEQRASIKATAAEAVKASEQITAAQLAFNRTKNEFNASVGKGAAFDNLLTGGGSTTIKPGSAVAVRQVKDEIKGVNEEAKKASLSLRDLSRNIPGVGSLTAGLASGLLGGAAISEAVRFLTQIAQEELEAYKRGIESQEKLERVSRDTGLSLLDQKKAVDELKASYSSFSESAVKDLLAVSIQAGKLPSSEDALKKNLGIDVVDPKGDLRIAIANRAKQSVDNELTRNLTALTPGEIAKLGSSLAVQRGIRGEKGLINSITGGTDPVADEEARKTALSDFLTGRDTETLSGRSKDEIEQEFAVKNNKLQSDLTERDKALALRLELLRQTTGLGSSGTVNNELVTKGLAAQLQNDKGALKFQDELDAANPAFAQARAEAAQAAIQQAEKARAIFKDVKSEFNDLAQRIGQGNPFVKFAIDSAQSIEDIKTKFQGFGSDFVAMMLKIEAQTRATELAQLRYNSSLTALKSNQEARRLDQAFIGITGPQTRDLAVVNAQLADLTQGGNFRDRADRLARPFAARPDARREFDKQLRDLLGIDTSGSGRFGREAVSDAVLNLTGKIDPRTLATSGDPIIRAAREAAITANRTKAASFTANLQDEIARRDAGQSIVKDAVEQLNLLQNSGLDRRSGIKEFLATTGALSESELTPDLRRARANALRESAKLESGREDEGFKLQLEMAKRLANIEKAVTDQGIKLHPDSVIPLSIDVSDQGKDSDITPAIGAAPTSQVHFNQL